MGAWVYAAVIIPSTAEDLRIEVEPTDPGWAKHASLTRRPFISDLVILIELSEEPAVTNRGFFLFTHQ